MAHFLGVGSKTRTVWPTLAGSVGGFATDLRLQIVTIVCSDAEPRSTPQEPQQHGYHNRNHDARDDREVKVESTADDMDVAGQSAERDAREPVPSEAGKNAQCANNDQETVHGAPSPTVADEVIIAPRRRSIRAD
ncbi:hypothetical protein [Paraburkholderia tuberum]|uniref:hypothetical protein n=1 Tax=Paraburkholderia tuberum TaxID=157910 RepID=UPI003CC577A2